MSTDSMLSARALASRMNGARSHGPRTAAGKAKSVRNALKHGLCAKKLLIVPEEDAAAFEALQAQLLAELAPVGALQAVLAERIVSAAWRLRRADRLEAEVLAFRRDPHGDLGLALMRDGNGTRSFETVMRYRNAALGEFLRAQKTLQARQAEARAVAGEPAAAPARARAGRPARRRARPWVVRPTDADRERQSDASSARPVIASRQTAPTHKPATANASRTAGTDDRVDRRVPDRPGHDAGAEHRALLPSSPAGTKQTREIVPDQGVDARTGQRSAA